MHSRRAWLGTAVAMACGTAAFGQVHDDATLHPAYTLSEAHPADWTPQVSHMDFMPDGRLVVLTHAPAVENTTNVPAKTGTLNLVTNAASGDPAQITYRQIARDLMEPMGVLVLDGKIYVAEKIQITEFSSADGNTWTPRKVANIPIDPTGDVNFQEYPFGLLHRDGHFYVASSGGVRMGGIAFHTSPEKLVEGKRSGIVKINATTGAAEVLNAGLRAPNGLIWGPEGEFFVTDNQGSYVPSNKLIHAKEGKNYGYFTSPQNPFRAQPETWPAVWMPHPAFSRSPSHPVIVKTGVYKGQLLSGDIGAGGVHRTFLEKVNGEYQGAVFSFSGGFSVGMQKVLELPDGSFLLGGFGRGDANNWGWKEKKQGLQKLTPKPGVTAFEMLAVRSLKDGFEVEFTKPAGAGAEVAANWTVASHTMQGMPQYSNPGGNMANKKALPVKAVQLSADRKRAFLQIDGLEPKTVISLQAASVVSGTGEAMHRPLAYYTLTSISPASFSTRVFDRAVGASGTDLKVRRLGSGLAVEVAFAGPHVLTLRTLKGEAVASRAAAGPGKHLLPAAAPGLYFVEVVAGSRRAAHPVAF